MASRTPTVPTPTEVPADVNINVAIPAALHKRMRIEAINKNIRTREIVVGALTAYLDD